MDYIAYLELTWQYLPYILVVYIFVTLVPKSIGKMKSFADADYKANRHKYHRCYGPELCCHALAGSAASGGVVATKQKQRKPVTRVYPKKSTAEPLERRCSTASTHVITRQVPPSSIQTFTHVNQIARMFESGNTPTTTLNPNATMHGAPVVLPGARKINRVTPNTILNDMLNVGGGAGSQTDEDEYVDTAALKKQLKRSLLAADDWQSEPITPTQTTTVRPSAVTDSQTADQQTNRRSRPISIQYAGTSATPSTSSPLSSPLSSPTSESPVRRTAPYNLQSSIEDIFAALARNAERNEQLDSSGDGAIGGDASSSSLLSPVTSIDDILSQRRLSRPLSAYSISDLLVGEENDVQVVNFLRTSNKQA